jgi:putative ABC transport system substrate-binding protein
MRRRQFLGAIGAAAAWPVQAVRAQQSGVPVVGFIHFASTSLYGPRIAAFREALSAAGYVDGKTIKLDIRSATNVHDFRQIASELVAAKVSVIVAGGSEAVSAAQQVTQTIPIVMAVSSDPVGTGFVKTLAHPGGNITGLSLLNPEMAGKRLELLREIVTNPSPAMVLWNTADPPAAITFKETEKASRTIGIKLLPAPIQRADEIERAFATSTGAKSLVVLPAPVMAANSALIADQALRRHLPSVSNNPLLPKAGGLMAYGPNFIELFRQAALYVAKILSGANAGDLPVQQATKFELIINLKTAKALGITIPQSILVRADEVIE